MEVFQSAPLTRGETIGGRSLAVLAGISIHSPHTRGDDLAVRDLQRGFDFNPLPSHEGRLAARCVLRVDARGISIHSPHARGDLLRLDADVAVGMSIHSPHARGDLRKAVLTMLQRHFNPLPSHEGRRNQMQQGFCAIQFQSTPLTRGETLVTMACVRSLAISIHSPHTRGDKQVLL